jgi:hypothetical protein
MELTVFETVFSANVALCLISSISFTEGDHILDLFILLTAQGPNESVRDYLSRLFDTATNKDILDQVVLAVGINGLRPEIKAIVMNKAPKNIEEIRHSATLAEKTVSNSFSYRYCGSVVF